MKENKLCRLKIEENIINVEYGKPLTLPLAQLNRDCEFRRVWEKYSGGSIGRVRISKKNTKKTIEEIKAYQKAYRQRPVYKSYQKAYRQRPEVKAHKKTQQRAYCKRPEIKAHRKAYYQRPEIKAHRKAYCKAYYQRKKMEKMK